MRILLVDDSQSDRMLAAREIRKLIHDARFEEPDGPQALEAAIRAGDYEVVVTDYRLGWADGLDILRRVKSSRPQTPVIMLTGTGGEEVAVEAMREGCDDYVLKSQLRFDRLPRAVLAGIERARHRAALAASERRYGELFSSVPVGLCVCHADGRMLEVNPPFASLLGIDPVSCPGRLLPEFLSDPGETWARALAGERLDTRLSRPDREERWAILAVRHRPDPEGGLECVLTDITERRRAERERTALLGELYHRLNNTLQVLVGMITTEERRTTDEGARAGLRDLARRIHALSLVQQRLYADGRLSDIDFAAFLRDLVASAETTREIVLEPGIEALRVPVAQAVPLGLAAHEMLSMALAELPETSHGRVRIHLFRDAESVCLRIVQHLTGARQADRELDRTVELLARQAGATVTVEQSECDEASIVMRWIETLPA